MRSQGMTCGSRSPTGTEALMKLFREDAALQKKDKCLLIRAVPPCFAGYTFSSQARGGIFLEDRVFRIIREWCSRHIASRLASQIYHGLFVRGRRKGRGMLRRRGDFPNVVWWRGPGGRSEETRQGERGSVRKECDGEFFVTKPGKWQFGPF